MSGKIIMNIIVVIIIIILLIFIKKGVKYCVWARLFLL